MVDWAEHTKLLTYLPSYILLVVVDRFHRALLSALKQTHCVLVVCDSELVSKHGA